MTPTALASPENCDIDGDTVSIFCALWLRRYRPTELAAVVALDFEESNDRTAAIKILFLTEVCKIFGDTTENFGPDLVSWPELEVLGESLLTLKTTMSDSSSLLILV